MENEVKARLDEEIKTQIEYLSSNQTLNVDDEAMEHLETLHKMRIEELRVEAERERLNSEKKNQTIKHVLEALGIVLPLSFYAYWMRRGFKFEETGAFTSTTFRSLFNRFRPTGKN